MSQEMKSQNYRMLEFGRDQEVILSNPLLKTGSPRTFVQLTQRRETPHPLDNLFLTWLSLWE